MEKFNQTPITPDGPIPVQMSPPQAAVLLAAVRMQNALGLEAHQLESTYGQGDSAAVFRNMQAELDRYAKMFVAAQGRRVVPATVIPG